MHASIYTLYIQPVLLNVALELLESRGESLLLNNFFFTFLFLKCTQSVHPLISGTLKSKKGVLKDQSGTLRNSLSDLEG